MSGDPKHKWTKCPRKVRPALRPDGAPPPLGWICRWRLGWAYDPISRNRSVHTYSRVPETHLVGGLVYTPLAPAGSRFRLHSLFKQRQAGEGDILGEKSRNVRPPAVLGARVVVCV